MLEIQTHISLSGRACLSKLVVSSLAAVVKFKTRFNFIGYITVLFVK